jgi:hypothetical protein
MVGSAGTYPPTLRLIVTEAKTGDGNNSYVLYSGVLHNDGPNAVQLDLAQMPGGYAGKMSLFLCSVEKWDARAKKWRLGFNNFPDQTNETRVVPAGETLEVCLVALPNLGVRLGERVRLSLRLSKKTGQGEVVSAPFVARQGSSFREK